MKNRITSFLSIALSIFIIAGCSSGNPTTPNKANLTNLAKTPTTASDNDIIKKINLSGRILDSITRKPIENASVLIYVIANDEVIKSFKKETEPGKANTSGSPGPGVLISPSPGESVNPGSIPPAALNTPWSPAATIAPAPIVEENEEKAVKPTPKPSIPLPVIKNPRNISNNPKPKTNITDLPQPTPLKSAEVDLKNNEKTGKELGEVDIISPLTTLKINDLLEFSSSTGNDGKFWINKVPDSNIIITVYAPNYKTVSIFNSDTSKVEDILLQPIDTGSYITSVTGSVISATNNPIENATVSASYVINESFSIPTSTNKRGSFQLEDVSIGERTFVATVKDETSKIISMGMSDFDVIKAKESENKKKLPRKKPTPSPSVDKEEPEIKTDEKIIEEKTEIKPTAENEEEAKTEPKPSEDDKSKDEKVKEKPASAPPGAADNKIKDEKVKEKTEEEIVPIDKTAKKAEKRKDYPLIKVNSVTDYIDLKGKITLPEETTLKSINVYLTFKKKGQPKEEVFLTDKNLDVGAESFELSLPKPDTGYYYHLEFVAVNKKGSFIYHHEFNVKKENKVMKVSFMQPLILGKTDFIEKDGEKLPIFTWLPVEGASFYKVSLDKIDKDNNLTTVWEGVTPFNTAIYPITTGSAKLNYANTYNWSVVAIKEGTGAGNSDKMQFSKLNITSWSDLSHSPNMAFSPTGDAGTEEIEEIDTEKQKKAG